MIGPLENTAGPRCKAILATVLLTVLPLAGCGQSGPLYLPDEAKPQDSPGEPATPPAEEEAEEENAEKTGT